MEGLKPANVTILDAEGRVLNKGGGDGAAAATEANNELRGQVEAYLQNKVSDILDGVVGTGNHRVQVSVDLDFESVEKTAESFDPQSKTVRSEQTEEETKENSPTDGNDTRESRTANYEIDRTVVKSVSSPGSVRKRVTVSVAVDGRWEQPRDSSKKADKQPPPTWKPRSPEEVAQLTELVRNAVGAQAGTDNVFVTCVKFENPVVTAALEDMGRTRPPWADWVRWIILGVSLLAGILLLRSLVRVMQDAANPPRPAYAELLPPEIEDTAEEDDVVREAVRVNDLLSRLEGMTKAEPGNFSKLVRTWLQEGSSSAQDRNAKKGR